MKQLFFLLATIFSFATLQSQIPQIISWQGYLTNTDGTELNGEYDLTIKLFDVEFNGDPIWNETHENVQISGGHASIILGLQVPLDLPFDKQYWLEMVVDDGVPFDRILLTSAPYSLNSRNNSGIFEGVPLILKDNDGNIRIKLDPDAGSLEFYDSDTLWYSLQVNSPPKSRFVNGDGSYSETENGKEGTYNRDGVLLHDRDRTSYSDEQEQVNKETKKYYHDDGTVYYESEIEIYADGANPLQKETKTSYKSSGEKIAAEITEKSQNGLSGNSTETQTKINYNNSGEETNKVVRSFQNGNLIKEENYQNGNKTSEMNYDENKSENSILNPDGTTSRKITQYQDQIKTEYAAGSQNTIFYQTQNSFAFKNSASDSELKIMNGENNGYMIGLDNSNPSNPSMTMVPDSPSGYTKFNGEAVFDDGLVSNGDFSGENGEFNGDLDVSGTKNFRIDYPFDPQNKYLYHACIESNEVLNQYSGNITTDGNGFSEVVLPEYFEVINTDFRYQLTVIGTFSQAIIAKKIYNNRFEIRTDKPNIEVSWQITARRNDKYMRDNPYLDVRKK